MKIFESRLSGIYTVRKLTPDDVENICALCSKNTLFYEYNPPFVSYDSVIDDMNILPPGKSAEDKYYIGFWDGDLLIAVMDLISGYPDEDTAFIGFFMTEASVQCRGVGSGIIADCLAELKRLGFSKVRLGVDRGNPQSFHFWSKNGFTVDSSYKGKSIMMKNAL